MATTVDSDQPALAAADAPVTRWAGAGRPTPAARLIAIVIVAAALLSMILAVVITVVLEQVSARHGHLELRDPSDVIGLGIVIIGSAGTVGAALAIRRPGHPVGWCFLALAWSTEVFGGLATSYAANVEIVHAYTGPLAPQLAILGDAIWLVWFGLVAVILQLTPTGRPVSRAWGRTLTATVAVVSAAYLLKLLQEPHLDPPLDTITHNPWFWPAAAPVLGPLDRALAWLSGIGPMIGAASLLVRYRRSQDAERQQLKWLALSVVPLPLLIIVSYIAAVTDRTEVLGLATLGYLVVIPASVWLSISRYRLYDVDRVLSKALTWGLLSLVLAAVYLGVVLLTTSALHGVTNGSQLAAGLAGVCAAGLATPVHRRAQQWVDRRFNRRQFETLRTVKRFVDHAPSGPPVDDVLRDALSDPSLTVAYVVPDALDRWTDASGHDLVPGEPAVDVHRADRVVARVSFDPSRVDEALVTAATSLAAGELENVALRSAVARQLEQVRQSRARIVQAQLVERARIERNLHDGAQQSLVAIAFELGAARLRLQHTPGTEDVQDRMNHLAQSLQEAVAELRRLANGLLPSALAGTGLIGALSELAGRTPIPLTINTATPDRRFDEPVEVTAWFIALESVTNAVKHAAPSAIWITLTSPGPRLVVEIEDDGNGGANPSGSGLRGLADRAEGIGGFLTVAGRQPQGTLIRAELPCES